MWRVELKSFWCAVEELPTSPAWPTIEIIHITYLQMAKYKQYSSMICYAEASVAYTVYLRCSHLFTIAIKLLSCSFSNLLSNLLCHKVSQTFLLDCHNSIIAQAHKRCLSSRIFSLSHSSALFCTVAATFLDGKFKGQRVITVLLMLCPRGGVGKGEGSLLRCTVVTIFQSITSLHALWCHSGSLSHRQTDRRLFQNFSCGFPGVIVFRSRKQD